MKVFNSSIRTTVFLTCFGVSLLGFSQEKGMGQIDFFIGEWDITTIDKQHDGSTIQGKAKSEVKYILDGNAIQDDFLAYDRSGNIVFRGTSIRSYNSRTDKFQIVWIMPGIHGITDISAEWKDGKLISTGKGYDGRGEFLERFEYYDISENAYSFRMDRSYDGGKTWIDDFGRMEAKRIK